MGEITKIAWTDSSWNGWIGCTKVGPGCDACYAEALDARHKWGGSTHWGPGVPRYHTSKANWAKPRKWNKDAIASGKRHLVFCSSLADVFDNEIPDEWRAELFALIRGTPALTWQLLTKRIGNAERMLPPDWGKGYPNVWLIPTIVNAEEAARDLPKLFEIPAAVYGVSYEPALGPVDWAPWLCPWSHSENRYGRRISWLIIGGESRQRGHDPRVFELDWALNGIAQCRQYGAAPFMKQTGARVRVHRRYCLPFAMHGSWRAEATGSEYGIARPADSAGADPDEWPTEIRVREFPDTVAA
jgi:protein gp37